ncbi:MAG: aminoacyl-tRNA hydrolase [Opitutae bacterium]|nr:aminoacyl-tRNA hydrolase [Opitutae bacterium]
MPVSVIYGLGNPGREYEMTRHNVGFRVLDSLAKDLQVSFRKDASLRGEFAKAKLEPAGTTLHLGKPLTFMNNSGECVGAHSRFHKIPPDEIVVVHDDIALPPGAVKISFGGGDGGHNGLKSIIQHCGEGFIRFRIGIGPKLFREQDLADFVLGKLNEEEQKIFESQTEHFIYGIKLLATQGISAAQNLINRKQ